ncbi:MAG TPA: peptidylprolyl isomerase [Anaeromyxobacteraceae bacterium]|nr:peptidylprolyl isomerase [Anaeromyxobacteraceae bacterium]
MTARRLFGALAAVVALAAPAGPALAQQAGLAARVNGVGIGRERLDRFFEEYAGSKGRNIAAIQSPEAYKTLLREALDVLVESELLAQEAAKRKLAPKPAEVAKAVAEARSRFPDETQYRLRLERSGFTEASFAEHVGKQLAIERLVAELEKGIKVTSAEVHAFYEQNRAKLTRPEEVHARHVLVGVAAGAGEEERAAARARAEAVRAEAEGGADFAELARRSSTDETAADGGDLGFFGRGRMVRPFEEAAFALQPGQLSGVVETPFGFHVIKVEARRGGELVPEKAARPDIERWLRGEKARAALRDEVEALRLAGRVEILVPLARGP